MVFPQINSWKINQKVNLIDKENFILDKKQIEEFLLIQHHLQLPYNKVEKLKYHTEGWIAAVNYIGEIIRTNKDMSLEENLCIKNEIFATFYNYLDYELLDNKRILNPSIKKYLLKSSILKGLDRRICKEFMGLDDCRGIMEKLLQIGLPIKKDNNGTYRYNRLFQYYLNNRAGREYDLENLHNKAFKIYRENGLLEGEVYHLLQLNNKEKIASLIKLRADHWIEKKRYDLLKNCLMILPGDYFVDYPVLYMYQGDLFYLDDKLELALKQYQKAETIFRQREDDSFLIEAILKILKVYFSVHSLQGLEYLDILKKYEDNLTDEQYQNFIRYRVIAMFITGNVKEAFSLLQKLSNSGGDIRNFKAMTAFIEGNLLEAINFITAVKGNGKDYFLESLHILIYLFMGKRYKAMELLWGKIGTSTGAVRLIYENLQLTLCQIMGRYKAGKDREKYQQLIEDEQNSILNTSWYNRQIFISLLIWEANYGDADLGIEFAEKRLAALQEEDYFFKAQLCQMAGINYFAKSNFVEAEKYFEEALSIVENFGNKLNLAVSLYWLTLTKYNAASSDCNEEIQQLISLCKENSYDFLFIRSNILSSIDPNTFVPILLQARENGVEEKYINKLLSEIKLSDIDQHPGYSLRIRTFGGFQLYRGKEKVDEDEWKRSKSRELLYILLIHYGKTLSREKLYNYLWPDKVDKSAKQNFYVTFGSLNKILEPTRISQQQPCFIESNNSYYGMTREITYFYDVAQFEGFIYKGENSDDKNIRIKYFLEAINIYQGNFLPEVLGLEWVDEERERLRAKFIKIASVIMDYHHQKGDYHSCIDIADKIQMIDPYVDDLYLYKMKSYNQLGKRGLLVKTYRECNNIFQKELGIKPNPTIENFYQQISIDIS